MCMAGLVVTLQGRQGLSWVCTHLCPYKWNDYKSLSLLSHSFPWCEKID